jgi:MFS family permease
MELKYDSVSRHQPPVVDKTLILVICSIISFFLSFVGSGINVALPSIGKEFNANAILLNWVVTLSTLTLGVLMIPFGRLADIIGIKKVFAIGIIIYLPAAVLTVLSSSIYMLLVCQLMQAVGLAMVFANSTAMLTAVYPANERGRALGINVGTLYFGFSIAPSICGTMIEHFGWRSIFFIGMPGCVLALILLFTKVKGDWVYSRGERFDYFGALLFAISIICIMYGFSIIPQLLGGLLILIGIVLALFFIKWESRTTSPVFDINIFRNNKVFLFSNITAFVSYSAVMAVTYLMSLYLQYNRGFSAQTTGFILVAQPLLQAVFSPISGRISDKFEPRVVASLGMGLTCLGLIPFAFLTDTTSVGLILAALLVLGMGFGLFSSPNTNAIMSSVSPKQLAVASATLSTMRTLGGLFSMAITMVLISVIVGRVEITPEYYPAFLTCVRVAFAIFSVLCLISVFTSLARGKLR